MIDITKASAGSGKTFHLAKQYIETALFNEGPAAYAGILAVTFTNKATGEMKDRILEELHTLATDPTRSHYFNDFSGKHKESAESIRKKAAKCLTAVLHDYPAFAVTNIDKFFLRALKAFAREMGHFPDYKVNLELAPLIDEAADCMLEEMEEGDALHKWLTGNMSDFFEKDAPGVFKPQNSIVELARLWKGNLNLQRKKAEKGVSEIQFEEMLDVSSLDTIRKACRNTVNTFWAEASRVAENLIQSIRNYGLSPADFSGKNRSFVATIERKYANSKPENDTLSASVLEHIDNTDKWFGKNASGIPEGVFSIDFSEFKSYFAEDGEHRTAYNTASLILDAIQRMGLVAQMRNKFKQLVDKYNILNLSDSVEILHDIIDGCPTPFVYEKLGVRFHNFLLDEFQDTSDEQWANFRPLIDESESGADSEGNEAKNLIVGDVKQSIYRFRGSEWKLLNGLDKEYGVKAETLKYNWRSRKNIVDFNNRIYFDPQDNGGDDPVMGSSCLPRLMDAEFGSLPDGEKFEDIYSDTFQLRKEKPEERYDGYVSVEYSDADFQCDRVVEIIRNLVDERQADYADIAVLVRTNNLGATVVKALKDNNIPCCSEESLFVKNSKAVCSIVEAMSLDCNPTSPINRYYSDPEGYYRSLMEKEEDSGPEVPAPDANARNSIVELALDIIRDRKIDTEGQEIFVESFLDCINDYVSVYGNELKEFLAYWNKDSFNPTVSSTKGADAVTVITIHKSKGLEFPVVIFPFAENEGAGNLPDYRWCWLDRGDELFGTAAPMLFPVNLRKNTAKYSLFRKDWEEYRYLKAVDDLNAFYVATTRAISELYVIASTPSSGKSAGNAVPPVARLLSRAIELPFESGEPCADWKTLLSEEKKKEEKEAGTFINTYESIPLGTRLKTGVSSFDYFGEDGETGADASERIKGILYHDILSSVRDAGDLDKAVAAALASGALPKDLEGEARRILSDGIRFVREKYGWFGDDVDEVLNEVSVTGPCESGYADKRMDRVEIRTGSNGEKSVSIIDFKFGGHSRRYADQVRGYVALYKGLGYADVRGFLWYVTTGEVVPV